MPIKISHDQKDFGVGDTIRVHQKILESGKERIQIFEGMLIAIKNSGINRTFTVRKIGEAGIGIERIFVLNSPTISKVDVIKKGMRGIKRAKLYYTRQKSPKEIEKIYSRAASREKAKSKVKNK